MTTMNQTNNDMSPHAKKSTMSKSKDDEQDMS